MSSIPTLPDTELTERLRALAVKRFQLMFEKVYTTRATKINKIFEKHKLSVRFETELIPTLSKIASEAYFRTAEYISKNDVFCVPDEHRITACHVLPVVEYVGSMFSCEEEDGIRIPVDEIVERNQRIQLACALFWGVSGFEVDKITEAKTTLNAFAEVIRNALENGKHLCVFSLSYKAYLISITILSWYIVRRYNPELMEKLREFNSDFAILLDNFLLGPPQ